MFGATALAAFEGAGARAPVHEFVQSRWLSAMARAGAGTDAAQCGIANIFIAQGTRHGIYDVNLRCLLKLLRVQLVDGLAQ